MSVYYEIEERLAIEKVNEDNKKFVELVADHIIAIGERVLNGLAAIGDLKVTADGKEFELTTESSLAYWIGCIDAVSSCESLNVFSDYAYYWKLDLEDYDNVGPFELMKYAESQGERFLESVLYEAFNYADCAVEGCGVFCAYGYKDDHKYCGEVPFKEIESIPEGEWYTPDTPQDVEGEFSDKAQFNEIINACRNLDALCDINEEYPNLIIDGENIEYFLNNPFIRSENDAEKFATNIAVILRLYGYDSQEICFWDYGKMNMIKLIVNADGTHKSEIAIL